MKIIYVDDDGQYVTIKCEKIEPAHLSLGKLIVDEGEKVIDLRDVERIVD